MEVLALIWKNVRVQCERKELELEFPNAEIFIGKEVDSVCLNECSPGGMRREGYNSVMYAHPKVVELSLFGIRIEAQHYSGPFEAKSWEDMELTPVTITADF